MKYIISKVLFISVLAMVSAVVSSFDVMAEPSDVITLPVVPDPTNPKDPDPSPSPIVPDPIDPGDEGRRVGAKRVIIPTSRLNRNSHGQDKKGIVSINSSRHTIPKTLPAF